MNRYASVLAAALCLFISFIASNSASAMQEVYVDFDTILMAVDAGATPGEMGIPPADELYDYSPEQREDILFYLNDRYGQHEVFFLEGLPPGMGSASVVTLNKGSGGFSDGVDFRNEVPDDTAEVNTIAAFKFIGVDPVTDPWTDMDVTLATANIVGHEAGHLMGIRHQDSFGPIGSGIGTFKDDYAPEYPFPPGAPETPTALSYLTFGLGLTFSGLTTESFISERAALKLAMADPAFPALVIPEASMNKSVMMAQPVPLADFVIPYPFRPLPNLKETPVEDLPLEIPAAIDARARVVKGKMDDTDEMGKHLSDYFSFTAEAGTMLTVEIMSKILEGGDRYADPVDIAVILLDGTTGGPLDYGPGTMVDAANDDDFATSDKGASLIDVVLPSVYDTGPDGFGTYVLEVASANEDLPFVSPGPGKDGTDGGDYELLIYQAWVVDEPYPPGFADFDEDTDVDGEDFLAWQRGLGIVVDATKVDGDVEGDGDVDLTDLFHWSEQHSLTGLPIPGSLSALVPEPSTLTLLSVFACGAVLRVRIR